MAHFNRIRHVLTGMGSVLELYPELGSSEEDIRAFWESVLQEAHVCPFTGRDTLLDYAMELTDASEAVKREAKAVAEGVQSACQFRSFHFPALVPVRVSRSTTAAHE